MKLVKSEATGMVHTIELTDKELNTLVIGMGHSSDNERKETASHYGVEILTGHDAYMLYSDLHDKHVEKK